MTIAIEMRRCPRCGEEKPCTSEFFTYCRRTTGMKEMAPASCRICHRARNMLWREKNRERRREQERRYKQRKNERAASFRTLFEAGTKASPQTIDALRKAMVQHPPDLVGEEDMLAYYRGFVAGAKRRDEESARFEECKDLVYRIAREMSVSVPSAYEDFVSAGYEGLLDGLRRVDRNKGELRPFVAQRIRGAIKDHKRTHAKARVREGTPLSILAPEGEEPEGFIRDERKEERSEVLEVAARAGLMGRDRDIAVLLSEGLLLREIGERLGITESRVSQLVQRIREKHGGELLALVSAHV